MTSDTETLGNGAKAENDHQMTFYVMKDGPNSYTRISRKSAVALINNGRHKIFGNVADHDDWFLLVTDLDIEYFDMKAKWVA